MSKSNERAGSPLRRLAFVAVLVMAVLGVLGVGSALASNGKVLILDSTVSGGAASPEAQAAVLAGRGVDIVNAAQWGAMTQADFAAYDAIVLGDPTCAEEPSPVAAAVANSAVWSPAISGKVILMGTDPTYHQAHGVAGAAQLINSGVSFAVSDPGHTGAYIALSCYYFSVVSPTPVPLLDHLSSFGTFQVQGQLAFSSCPANSHIVATSPALSGLTDADLSNWGCSAHESFTQWPADFEVLAINSDIGTNYTATDGTVGGPYILSRGATVISNISLSPTSATNPLGATHTLTATVSENGAPVVGKTVTFKVVAGPNAGLTGTGVTDATGKASFGYTSSLTGTDLISASYVDSLSRTETSNTVSKTWEIPAADCTAATLLVGQTTLAKSAIDNDVAGMAEAFRARASANGTASVACVFLAPTNAATQLVVGIYADNGGHPGALLAQGTSLGALINGVFNTVLLPPVPLAAGTKYWITVLSPYGFGTLRFRDHCCGFQSQLPTGPSENSKALNLANLPAVWSTGDVWPRDAPLLGWAGGLSG